MCTLPLAHPPPRYFWALGGMYLFSELDLTDEQTLTCIHEYSPADTAMSPMDEIGHGSVVDFSQFWASNMRLFQILTGSNWHLIMYATICSANKKRHAIYFITFHLIAALVLLQIVIAIYVEAFIAFQDKEDMIEAEREKNSRIDLDESLDDEDMSQYGANGVSAEERAKAFVNASKLRVRTASSRGNMGGSPGTPGSTLVDRTNGSRTARKRVGSIPGESA